ncbi:SpoIIE family protein phosphatase [Phaeacidiphilus oryzae]|uniref:SpoIIE family protein phosphatase n=1 Tax=Phaeacidiphilus oryzae TaxID=348818 RepID=UPI000A01EA11|nr:SpoIIE family protein phosphatase [Phaeacidiphilus oryzae]
MVGSRASGARYRRFPPQPESVRLARRFVRSVLGDADPETVADAELLVSELVTNGALHARTELEVEVQADGDAVRVRVADHRPDRPVVPPLARHPYSSTEWGLAVVEELAFRHGVEADGDRKTVWCEMRRPEASVRPPPSAWTTESCRGDTATVALIDLPYALYVATQQHWEALIRELTLAPSVGERLGVGPEEVAVAHDTSNMVGACMTTALEGEPRPPDTLSLMVTFPVEAAVQVRTLHRVLERAEAAAQHASLLTLPALPQIRALRRWLLDQLADQLAGGPPTAWTLVTGEPGARPLELSSWEDAALHESRVPMIAADDWNRIIAVNEPAAELLGWRPEELVGRPLTVVIPEHLRRRHRAAFASLLLTGRPRLLGRSIPLPALHRDGRHIPVRLDIQTQESADGRTMFVAQLAPRTTQVSPPAEHRYAAMRVPDVPHALSLPGTARQAAGEPTGGPAGGRAVERLPLLADTQSALNSAPNLEEGLRRACRILAQQLADWCVVDLLDEQGQVERVCVVHREPTALDPRAFTGALPPVSEGARGPLPRVLRGAGPLLCTDIPPPEVANSALNQRQLELFDRLGAHSAVLAPLRAGREVLGALTLARVSGEHPFTKQDLPLITELARGIALGVDHARLNTEVHNTAEQLQHVLLPDLPQPDHLRLVARYAPSSTTAKVGGDWYDAFVLPNGNTVLVIGDVSGHDLKAAVAMSTLRNMLRGIAVDRQEPPGEVLRRLDLASRTLSPDATATCVYCLIKGPEGGPWRLEHASAGHPPPLLITAEGKTRYLEDGAGLLIGMDPERRRATACDPLPAHATVLLYTDGLIERRGESLDRGLARLRAYAAELGGAPLDTLCDELIIRLGAESDDDIALLALRPSPPDRPGPP